MRFESLTAPADSWGLIIMGAYGAGSEADSSWHPATGVWAGFAVISAKQALLSAVINERRAKGFQFITVGAPFRLNQRQNQFIKRYPPSNGGRRAHRQARTQ